MHTPERPLDDYVADMSGYSDPDCGVVLGCMRKTGIVQIAE